MLVLMYNRTSMCFHTAAFERLHRAIDTAGLVLGASELVHGLVTVRS